MPYSIKWTLILLYLAAILSMLGTYLDMPVLNGYDELLYAMDAIWFVIITRIAWGLVKQEDLRMLLVCIAVVVLVFNLFSLIEFGFFDSSMAYAAESLVYIAIVALLSAPQSKAWYLNEGE